MTPTEALLVKGGFTIRFHPGVVDDVRDHEDDNPGCWQEMKEILFSVRDGTARSRDWDAPLSQTGADIGELRNTMFPRHYRLYVHAERESNELLVLLFTWKPDGPAGLPLQDTHIEIASGRLITWPN
ncbi:hypothetical protein [Mycolicibacterium nivoides]|uniref:Lipoprotein n=1 Tax=Mycolicibacterium nivoides TaxID=2487344 RepID=A0ABW9LAM9_9MYCO